MTLYVVCLMNLSQWTRNIQQQHMNVDATLFSRHLLGLTSLWNPYQRQRSISVSATLTLKRHYF